jgi:hypothetical protein
MSLTITTSVSVVLPTFELLILVEVPRIVVPKSVDDAIVTGLTPGEVVTFVTDELVMSPFVKVVPVTVDEATVVLVRFEPEITEPVFAVTVSNVLDPTVTPSRETLVRLEDVAVELVIEVLVPEIVTPVRVDVAIVAETAPGRITTESIAVLTIDTS